MTHIPIVNFLVCGVQKGGTSALDGYLRSHPDVCMADVKEPHFFDREKIFTDKEPDYSKYHKYFHLCGNKKAVGESTPIYIYWKEAIPRIWQYNPQMKLIILLRNPIERAYSHWNMERVRGKELLAFGDAIRNEIERCREALPNQHRIYSYVSRGFYVEQLRRILDYFPRDNVFIAKSEQLKNSALETMNNIFRFLNLSTITDLEHKCVHASEYLQNMEEEDKLYLRAIYEYEIKALERLLGWELSEWLNA